MAKILVGFMGSGKSSLARLLDPAYIDMDVTIQERLGMPIADFFAQEGESAFRQVESQVLGEVLNADHVVATGGGVVVNPANRQLLAQHSETIYLKADFETLYDRISQDQVNQRPLFLSQSKEEFRALFDSRQAWYEEVASLTIDVATKTPQEIAEELR